MQSFYQAMRQCFRKASFPTDKVAKKRRNQIINEGGPKLFVYGCTECGNYHLTKNPQAEGQVF